MARGMAGRWPCSPGKTAESQKGFGTRAHESRMPFKIVDMAEGARGERPHTRVTTSGGTMAARLLQVTGATPGATFSRGQG